MGLCVVGFVFGFCWCGLGVWVCGCCGGCVCVGLVVLGVGGVGVVLGFFFWCEGGGEEQS